MAASPGLDALEAIAGASPASAEGYRRMRTVIESPGALSVAHKALLVAVGSAVRGDPDLTRRELQRGRDAGLTDDEITTGAIAVLLSRGESAYGRLLAAAGELAVEREPRPGADVDGVQYFLRYNRSEALPPRMAVLAERAPDVFEGYFRMHHAALTSDPAAAKLAELALCSLIAADLQGAFVAIHAVSARRAGASDEELVEAVLCAIPVGGVGAWAISAAALFPDT